MQESRQYIHCLSKLVGFLDKSIAALKNNETPDNSYDIKIEICGLQIQKDQIKDDIAQLKDEANEEVPPENVYSQVNNRDKQPQNKQNQEEEIIYDSEDKVTIEKIEQMKQIDLELGEQQMKFFLHEKKIQSLNLKKKQQREDHTDFGSNPRKMQKIDKPDLQCNLFTQPQKGNQNIMSNARDYSCQQLQREEFESLKQLQEQSQQMKSYFPQQVLLPPNFGFFNDQETQMQQVRFTPPNKAHLILWDDSIQDKMSMGQTIHLLMGRLIQNKCNNMQEYFERYTKLLTQKQLDYFFLFGQQTLEYLKLRKLDSNVKVEEQVKYKNNYYRFDVLAQNEKECLIIDWKFSRINRQDIMILDYKAHFSQHIKAVQGMPANKNKKVTIMILPLQICPIEFVEYTLDNIESIQKEQWKNELFYRHLMKKARTELQDRKEDVMKRQFKDSNGLTKTIAEYFLEMELMFQGQFDHIITFSQFISKDCVQQHLLSYQQSYPQEPFQDSSNGEQRREDNEVINFYILHTLAQNLESAQSEKK